MGLVRLQITVFLTGAAFMALEIISSRILAPYLGTSIIVWTSLIGVALLSLSAGYYLGGKLSDRKPDEKLLSLIIASASLYVTTLVITKDPVVFFISSTIRDLRIASILAVVFVLLVPSVLLGMVSPYAIKLATVNIKKVGTIAGRLYAISTFGSILGTFLAGFILISYLGHTNILLVISAILLFASALIYGRINFFHLALVVIIFGALFFSMDIIKNQTSRQFFDIDTVYNRTRIFDAKDPKTSKPIKVMVFDPRFVQSAIYYDSDELVFDVYKTFNLAFYFKPDISNALMIGGAAYTYPSHFLKAKPEARMDVVEIDEGLTRLAKEQFNFDDQNPNVSVFHEDARNFLNREASVGQKKYDVVFEDAFSSASSVPFQLATIEAVNNIDKLLSSDGIVVANIISALGGDKSKFLAAEFNTYKKVFPKVFLFPVETTDTSKIQNIILVAVKGDREFSFKSDDLNMQSYLDRRYLGNMDAETIYFSDDFAPVENYLVKILDN